MISQTDKNRRHPSPDVLNGPFAVMGIVNVTPDSFYDGGRYNAADAAVRHGIALAGQGAHVLDVGGESTRPGAADVPVEEECARILPVIERLAVQTGLPISVDTRKAEVARRAVQSGASWINDVSAGRADAAMPDVAATLGCPVVLMHSRKTPGDMQTDPWYNDVTGEVIAELQERVAVFLSAGVAKGSIIVDPGIGFAKRLEDNVALLRRLDELVNLGYPVLIGASRKSFIGKITGKDAPDRLAGSLAAVGAAYAAGARIFRVHDVAETSDYLKVMTALVSKAR